MQSATNITPYEIEGEKFYTAKQFALLSDKTTSHIYHLIRKGNKSRKLKHKMIAGKPMIYACELHMFPFKMWEGASEAELAEDDKTKEVQHG